MKDSSVELAQFEPTVFGAMRRYSVMVLAFALAGVVAAVGYTLFVGKTYQAKAEVTVAVPQSQQGEDPGQYLDSQVLLLESSAVAQKATSIAYTTLHSNILSAGDFSSSGGSVSLNLPEGAAVGSYGASIVGVTFTASSPTVAQAGVTALLEAFADVRSATIADQFKNAIAGIDNAINNATDNSEQVALEAQRTQLLANEQIDLAQQPTMVWADAPTSTARSGWKTAAVIGLVIGLVLGAVAAYVRANLRRGLVDRRDPAALYSVPLIGEIPALEADKTLRSKGAAARELPVSADPHSAVAEAFRFAAGSVERIRAERGSGLSLVFVSALADASKSIVVANLALAIAEGGTRVLVVDADASDASRTSRLLLGTPPTGSGLEEVLAGHLPLAACVYLSPLDGAIAVLPSSPTLRGRVTGAARATAASALLATAKSSFDIVLIDSPGLLQVADSVDLVGASDAVIIVLGPDEQIRDHAETLDRLKLIGSDIVGYIYVGAPMPPRLARHLRNGSSPGPMESEAVAGLRGLSADAPLNGGSGRSTELRRG